MCTYILKYMLDKYNMWFPASSCVSQHVLTTWLYNVYTLFYPIITCYTSNKCTGRCTIVCPQLQRTLVPTISAFTRWNCLATTDASKSRSTPILTVRCSFQRVFGLGSVRCGWTDTLYDYKAATTTTRPNPSNAPTDVGRCTSEPRPCYKVSLSSMYSQRQKS